MKGLLAKDYALMKQRAKIMLVLVVWAFFMRFAMDDSSFVVGWVTMIAVITALGTISYDEYDNCMPFLMTLPVTRKGYALEKYLFTMICSVIFWIISVVIVIITGLFSEKSFSFKEELPPMMIYLLLILIIISVCTPPQLKWGAEKGRTVMLVLFGVVFAGAFLVMRFGNGLLKVVQKVEQLSMPVVITGAVVLSLVITAVSVMISIRIMENKEF